MVNYRGTNNEEKYDGAVIENTMKTYINGIKRHFRTEWGKISAFGTELSSEKKKEVYE